MKNVLLYILSLPHPTDNTRPTDESIHLINVYDFIGVLLVFFLKVSTLSRVFFATIYNDV